MKKYLLLIILLLITVGCVNVNINTTTNKKTDNGTLMSKYSELQLENIKSLEVSTYTEGGVDTEEYTDMGDIVGFYNSLDKIKLGEETKQACEDNTTIYNFTMIDDSKIKIEIECDWVIIDGKRYLIEK